MNRIMYRYSNNNRQMETCVKSERNEPPPFTRFPPPLQYLGVVVSVFQYLPSSQQKEDSYKQSEHYYTYSYSLTKSIRTGGEFSDQGFPPPNPQVFAHCGIFYILWGSYTGLHLNVLPWYFDQYNYEICSTQVLHLPVQVYLCIHSRNSSKFLKCE